MSTHNTQSVAEQLKIKYGNAIRIGVNCDIATDIHVEIEDGSFLALGDNISILHGTTIQVHRGATVVIGKNVAIGKNTFISSMIGIRIGDGVGISNMVDLHDHNHCERSHSNLLKNELTCWASGFIGAPIVIESGAIISNKVSITAGVCVGQNTIIGANSVVIQSIPPNTVVGGIPAKIIRTFDGPLVKTEGQHTLKFAWFGTSIMEHLEAYNSRMSMQADLPQINSSVTVEKWRNRGYVQRLQLALQIEWPHLKFLFNNYGAGGVTSRDILKTVQNAFKYTRSNFDIIFFGCGINDVWRGFQGRTSEAVDIKEFDANYREILRLISSAARQVVCISETPFGWDSEFDINEMNSKLAGYNNYAVKAAADMKIHFIDTWSPFTLIGRHLESRQQTDQLDQTLWSDGVHLSELGDTLMLKLVQQYLHNNNIISKLTRYDLHEREEALVIYQNLLSEFR